MPFTLDADQAAAALEDRGYDVSRETSEDQGERGRVNLVSGRLDEASPRQIWLDAGGILRMQLTRQTDEGATERVTHHGRQYKVSRETQTIINIWVTLTSIEELDTVLDQLEDVTQRPRPGPNPPAPPDPVGVKLFPTKEGGAGAESDTPPPLPPVYGGSQRGVGEGPGERSAPPILEASTDLAPPLADEALTDKGNPVSSVPKRRRRQRRYRPRS